MLVRPLDPDDYLAVAAVFAEGIATGLATFETVPPTWEKWTPITCGSIAS